MEKGLRLLLSFEKFLRKCRFCGVEANNENDLQLFKLDKNYPHGRQNVCKKCDAEDRRKHYYDIKEKLKPIKRQRDLISNSPKPLRCYFCKENIIKLFGEFSGDHLVFHSVDGDHNNWEPINKVPAHSSCHISYHRNNYQENFEFGLIPVSSKEDSS